MNQQQGNELARDFVCREFVERGIIADLNVHWDIGADGLAKPHAHLMLTMREVGEEGFGAKVRDWNRTEFVQTWRGAWAVAERELHKVSECNRKRALASAQARGLSLSGEQHVAVDHATSGKNLGVVVR